MSPTPDQAFSTFQLLAEQSMDMMCRVSLDRQILYASPACKRLLGWSQEEMVGKGPQHLVLEEDLPIVRQSVAFAMQPGVEDFPHTVRMNTKDGEVIWVEINARMVRDEATGDPVEMVLVFRDITERKQFEEKLHRMAMTDGLTGLANRRAFDETLEREWKRVLREASHTSLILLDVDHFKAFNDHYGHQVGDDCLRAVAHAVEKAVGRPNDLVARYGGEEIAVILPKTDLKAAMELGERIRRRVQELALVHEKSANGEGVVTISVGVAAALSRHGGTMKMPESLLMAADTALYKAKLQGRNRVATAFLVASPELALAG
jgi:diguanylate cyclase (GGDEF)-like protein/PAS domain S-box-containing protein